jgi:succinate-acetate transporter protein
LSGVRRPGAPHSPAYAAGPVPTEASGDGYRVSMSTTQPSVVVRPLATPLPLGFLALCIATLAFSAVQLSWIPASQGRTVALAAVALTAPLQLLACVIGFLARDPVAATGMGILSGSWAAAGLATLSAPPGTLSGGLGIVLVGAGIAMLVPAAAAWPKPIAALVMSISALRFGVTGIAHLLASDRWLTIAGWIGVVLAAVSLYAALAFELEGTTKRAVLPLFRSAGSQLAGDQEPGVRPQL